MIDFKVIIVAIFDDNDFPYKVTTEIHGKPMIQYVFESAKDAGATEIVIATDSPRVGMIAEDFGAEVCMIVDDSLNSIGRLSEVVDRMGWDDKSIIVNLPSDAPLTPSSIIKQVAENLAFNDEVEFSILYSNISREDAEKEFFIKMIVDENNHVMYLSRCPIPYQTADKDITIEYKKHMDLNAYYVGSLKKYKELPSNELANAERIEELRLLYTGLKIYAAEANNLIGQRVFSEKDIGKVQLQISPNR